jgi:multimeric flavodoxin WrbA
MSIGKTMNPKPLFIPVILGTVRKGRASENVARFVFGEVQKREGVETELIDLRDLKFAFDDAGEAIKDAKFSETVARADGLVLIVPEYNHGYPGILKHVLDSNLKEYIHKDGGNLRSLGRRFWRRARDREYSAGTARAWARHYFLGW